MEESKRQLKKKNPYLFGEKLLCRTFQRLIHQKAFKWSLRLKDNTTFSPFTEKGDQYARINSKFLSTKGIKEEESYLEGKKYSAESFKTDPPKSFKREPDTEDNKALPFFTGKKVTNTQHLVLYILKKDQLSAN